LLAYSSKYRVRAAQQIKFDLQFGDNQGEHGDRWITESNRLMQPFETVVFLHSIPPRVLKAFPYFCHVQYFMDMHDR